MRPLIFLYEIESLTIFIWSNFDIMGIFGSVSWCESIILLFLYILIFQKWQSLEPPSSPLGWHRHMRPQTFLYGIESLTIFTWRIFWHNGYFWQHSALKWICFATFVYFNISNMAFRPKHDVCLHSGCSSALVQTEAILRMQESH